MEPITTKDQILETSLKLFSQRGYESVGVQEIAELSKITKPTLYYYFGSKKGILESILNTNGTLYFDELQNTAVYKSDMVKTLTDLLKFQGAQAANNSDFLRLHISLCFAPSDTESSLVHKTLRDKIEECLYSFFIKSTKEIGNMKGYEKIYSKNFINIMNSLSIDIMNKEIELDDQTVYRVIHSFMYGIVS